jgi:hypothetical protein
MVVQQLTGSRCQHHRSGSKWSTRRVAGDTRLRPGLRQRQPRLVSADPRKPDDRFGSTRPAARGCAKPAAGYPEACRPDVEPLHPASVESVATSACLLPPSTSWTTGARVGWRRHGDRDADITLRHRCTAAGPAALAGRGTRALQRSVWSQRAELVMRWRLATVACSPRPRIAAMIGPSLVAPTTRSA